jgi:hypothetical protein
MMRRLLYILLLLLATAQLPANAALRAWVDNPDVAPGDTVRLTLAHDGQTSSRPDLTPLKQDFDVLGSSTSSNVQIVNGSISSTTQMDLTLAPKRNGRLTIPSLTWGSDKSPALAVTVTSNGGGANSSGSTAGSAATPGNRVFMETEEDPKSPYVQAAVHVTVRVYAGVPLSHGDLEFADSNDAIVRQLGSDAVSNVERNGQQYQVITRQYVIFPQHSGKLTIPGPTLSGEIPDRSRGLGGLTDPFSGLFGNSPFGGMLAGRKPIRLHGDPIVLDVKPRPSGVGASYWLPARNVTLQAHWNPSQLLADVGDPITLDLQLQADGLTAAQLPDLSTLLTLPPELKAYPDQPKLKDDAQGSHLIGSREQSIALIADAPGRFTIPELRLSWWDTQANQAREAILPAQTLTVQPAPGATSSAQAPAQTQQSPLSSATRPVVAPTAGKTAPPAIPTSDNTPWKWTTLGLGLLWIATVAAWLITRKRGGSSGEPFAGESASKGDSAALRARPLRAAFLAACQENDAPQARRNLLLWANAERPGAPIRGLNALAKLTGDREIANELEALDRACYAGAPWTGSRLATLLTELPSVHRDPQSRRRARDLAPLYR